MKSASPGELIQVDHMSVKVGPGFNAKHFEAICPTAKIVIAEAYQSAGSINAKRFLEKLINALPFKIKSIQVDGGSEFMKEFENACEKLGIALYPSIVKSWRTNWEKITPFMSYPMEIRKVIYTTNIVESLNSSLRKAVRNLGHFPTEDSLMKVLYLVIQQSSKKWTMPIRDWKQALNRFAIMYSDRFPEKLMN